MKYDGATGIAGEEAKVKARRGTNDQSVEAALPANRRRSEVNQELSCQTERHPAERSAAMRSGTLETDDSPIIKRVDRKAVFGGCGLTASKNGCA